MDLGTQRVGGVSALAGEEELGGSLTDSLDILIQDSLEISVARFTRYLGSKIFG